MHLHRVNVASFCDPLPEMDEKKNLIPAGDNTGANTGGSVPESFKTFNDLYESYREAFVSWLNRHFPSIL
jgi:protein involved in sex pheromone biosynthesis